MAVEAVFVAHIVRTDQGAGSHMGFLVVHTDHIVDYMVAAADAVEVTPVAAEVPPAMVTVDLVEAFLVVEEVVGNQVEALAAAAAAAGAIQLGDRQEALGVD